MRPTDEEIQEKAKEFTDSFHHQFPQLVAEIAMRWTRDFDPFYYTEDGDFPPHQTKVLAYFANNTGVLVAELRGKDQRFWEDEEASMYELNEVKCWMYIPEPKR